MNDIPKHLLSDDIIFHYTTVNIAIQNILFENRLRLSPRKNSVDPVEYLNFSGATLFWGKNDESLTKLGGAILVNGKNKVDRCKQICFCKSKQNNNEAYWMGSEKDAFGFLKPRMWDQYGERYKGLCLAFSKSELIKSSSFVSKEIDYVDFKELEEDKMMLNLNSLNKKGENQTIIEFDRRVLSKVFRKHKDYSGENEFRICSFSKNEFDWLDIKKSLKAIIFSPRYLNEFNKDKIMEYSKRMGVEVIGVNWKSEGVDIVEYKPI